MAILNGFHYQTFGNKNNQPILFLHGFMGRISEWTDIVTSLKDSYYCVTIDLPGHGQTMFQDEKDYRMENCAENLIAFLDKLSNKKFHIISYSMGGRLAFFLVVHYRDYFDKIIIESSSPGLKTETEKRQRLTLDYKLAEKLKKEPFEKFLSDWYRQRLFLSLTKDSSSFKSMFQKRLNNKPAFLSLSLRYMGIGKQPSLWDELIKIKSAILLIAGEKDDKFKKIASEIVSNFKSFKLAVIENAGHVVHFENKNEYMKQIQLFLKNN